MSERPPGPVAPLRTRAGAAVHIRTMKARARPSDACATMRTRYRGLGSTGAATATHIGGARWRVALRAPTPPQQAPITAHAATSVALVTRKPRPRCSPRDVSRETTDMLSA